jgi:hypothetical protein
MRRPLWVFFLVSTCTMIGEMRRKDKDEVEGRRERGTKGGRGA